MLPERKYVHILTLPLPNGGQLADPVDDDGQDSAYNPSRWKFVRRPGGVGLKRLTAAALVVSLASLTLACVVIEEGEVGVSKSFGAISDEPVLQGVAFVVPVARQVEVWNVKLQEIKETAQVPSSEGLIVGLDISLLFRIEPDRAPQIRKTVGQDYINRLIVPYFRSALRDVVSGFAVKNLYAESGRKAITSAIRELLRQNLKPRGIRVVDVHLHDVKLP